MPNKRIKRDEPGIGGYSELIFLCISFLVGAVLGSLLVPCFSAEGEGWFPSYYASVISAQAYPGIKSFFISNSVLLIIIFSGAFVKYGIFMIPAAIGFKGLTISLSVTCYIRAFGIRGYLPAVFSIFFSAFIVVAALMLLSCQAIDYTRAVNRRGAGTAFGRLRFDRGYFFSGSIALLLIFIAGIIHCYLMPVFTYMTMAFVR